MNRVQGRKSAGRRALWVVVTVLSNAVGLYAVSLVLTGFPIGETVADNSVLAPYGLNVHVAAAGITLLAGPWQFAARLRTRAPLVHRVSGRLYVAAAVVGGATGAVIALGTTGGVVAGTAFLLLGTVWVGQTMIALHRVRAGDIEGHRRWMLRSFASAFAAVTLRLYLGAGLASGLEYEVVYPWVAWLSWVPNLVVVELWIRRRDAGRSRPRSCTVSAGSAAGPRARRARR